MPISAKEFVDQRIAGNVHATSYEPEGDRKESERLAKECWREADFAGISRRAIEAECGNLVTYVASAIERVNDAEVQRLIAKNKF